MKKSLLIWISMSILFFGLIVYYYYPEDKIPKNIKIDRLVVYISNREMLAFSNGKLIKTYKISLGREPIGDKEYEGDCKTPEGIYFINNKNPNSICHKNLGISYPNQSDILVAKKLGKQPGGDIKIHGQLNRFGFIHKFHRWFDLTYGCIMVTDDEIDELYISVIIGSQIEIKP